MGLACMGFLPFNIQKNARVFMGDVGSVLLGFVYAGLVVGLSYSLNDFMVLCAFLFPFYADELITLGVRIRETGDRRPEDGGGRRETGGWRRTVGMLMQPHRGHVYQLLVNEMGLDHWKVSVGYGVLQLMVGVGALTLRWYGVLVVVVFLVCCFVGFWGFGYLVRKRVQKNISHAKAQSTLR